MAQVQHEIIEPSPLLTASGRLTQTGWARQPRLDCNLENARICRFGNVLQRFRIKRWDYYGVAFPEGYFSATIADLGYAGQVFAYLIDFAAKTYVEGTVTIPLGRGIRLPRNSDEGTSEWQGKKARLVFDVAAGKRSVAVDWRAFDTGRLSARLSFQHASHHESTVTVTPIGKRRFYYNRKINCIPVVGTIRVGGRTIEIDPGTSSGTLDWGRGAWEYNSFWVWASASGFLGDGRRVGLNMGYGFGDTAAATENTLLVNGIIHKLGTIDFDYDDTNFMRPWTMQSPRANLTFTPFLDRTAKTNLLLIRSEVHQMFGHYSGTVIDDSGAAVPIDDVVGWAEEHHARW